MIVVEVEKNLVILAINGTRRDILLDPDRADHLAYSLRAAADQVVDGPTLLRGEQWDAKVESFDGFVAMRFSCSNNMSNRIPLPPAAARSLADAILWKSTQAKDKLRIVLQRR